MTDGNTNDGIEARLRPLWMRAQTGDEAAYREVLGQLAARLRAYFARRLFGLSDEVEDLVQETLLALHLQRGTYDPELPLTAWVHAIARHKLVDLLRRYGRHDALNDSLDDLAEELHPVMPEEQPARRDLSRLMEALPPAQRLAIVYTKLEGLSVAEAAQRSGMSVSAVKVSVHRGLKRLARIVMTGE